MKALAVLLCLAVAASARMAYQFSDGYLAILGAEPVHSFDCTTRSYGYYADVDADCKVFHVCLPIMNDAGEVSETYQFSFFCNNGTIFSQEHLSCTHPEDAFPCEEAETLFELSNIDFGRIPEEGEIPNLPGGTPIVGGVSISARSSTDVEITAEEESDVDAAPAETREAETSIVIPVSNGPDIFSADAAAEASVNIPAEVPLNIPSSVPVDTPAEETVDTPAEETSATPAEETSDTPAEETNDIPAEALSNIPSAVLADTPAEETVNTPAEETSDTPAEETNDIPTEALSNIPSAVPADIPDEETVNLIAEDAPEVTTDEEPSEVNEDNVS